MKYILFLIIFLPCISLAAVNQTKQTSKAVASAVSMGASINSSAADCGASPHYSFHSVWSAGTSPIGTLNLQASNDGVTDGASVTTWTDVPVSVYTGSVAVTGNTGSSLINAFNAGYKWCRAVYTRTSGTGTITVRFFGKAP